MEAGDDAIVVVGLATNALVEAAAVKCRTGDGEVAVVIPKRPLIEAVLLHIEELTP
jgi:GGDEF domain-containing protein